MVMLAKVPRPATAPWECQGCGADLGDNYRGLCGLCSRELLAERVSARLNAAEVSRLCREDVNELDMDAPNCPKCGRPMTGGAPHGPWPIQWECRPCNVFITGAAGEALLDLDELDAALVRLAGEGRGAA